MPNYKSELWETTGRASELWQRDSTKANVEFAQLAVTSVASIATAQITTEDTNILTSTLANTSVASITNANLAGSLAATPAAIVKQNVVGNMSIGILRIVGNSVASGAVLEISNKGFISITSVVLTTVSNTDYAIRVQVGTETRWIPLFTDAAIIGAAAF